MEQETVPRGLLVRDSKPVIRTSQEWNSTQWVHTEISPVGTLVVHPDDVPPDAVTFEGAGCCGLHGDHPNTSCRCGAVVATTKTDCYTARETRFAPSAVTVSDEKDAPITRR